MALNMTQVAALGLVAAGVWWWSRDTAPAAEISAPTNIDACLKFRPDWGKARCESTLKQLEQAYTNAKSKVESYMILRDAQVRLGNMAEVRKLDAEIAPWQRALADHKADYWKLTGVNLG